MTNGWKCGTISLLEDVKRRKIWTFYTNIYGIIMKKIRMHRHLFEEDTDAFCRGKGDSFK